MCVRDNASTSLPLYHSSIWFLVFILPMLWFLLLISLSTPTSYVNFYIANEAVIVPQFGDAIYDAKAIQTLTPLFAPKRTVLGVSSRDILIGGGNIHCITQQVPSREEGSEKLNQA